MTLSKKKTRKKKKKKKTPHLAKSSVATGVL